MGKAIARALVLVGLVGLWSATVQAEEDHLKGYKIKDLNKVPGPRGVTIANDFGSETCDLKKPQFFLSQSEQNGSNDPRGNQAGDFICYKAKCAGTLPPITSKISELGTHSLESKRSKLICLPVNRPAVCGNNNIESGEECDTTADADCPGACQADCSCGPTGRVCCDMASECRSASSPAVCDNLFNGVAVGDGAVCDASGNCVPPSGTGGGCCERSVAGERICSEPTTLSACQSDGGTFYANAICEPFGLCNTSAPVCGDNIRNGVIELCDGSDDVACPGLCQPNCNCPQAVCGNNVRELGEWCDGTDATACPGLCQPDCSCNQGLCGDSAYPTCGGACPAGEVCQAVSINVAVCQVGGHGFGPGCKCVDSNIACNTEYLCGGNAPPYFPVGQCPAQKVCITTEEGCSNCSSRSCCAPASGACTSDSECCGFDANDGSGGCVGGACTCEALGEPCVHALECCSLACSLDGICVP